MGVISEGSKSRRNIDPFGTRYRGYHSNQNYTERKRDGLKGWGGGSKGEGGENKGTQRQDKKRGGIEKKTEETRVANRSLFGAFCFVILAHYGTVICFLSVPKLGNSSNERLVILL